MANLVDTYLARLEARLLKRLPVESSREHAKEIGTHVQESISDKVSRGMPEEQAIINALRSVGSDRLVADSLIRARSGITTRSVWRIGWLSVVFLLAYCAFFQGIQWSMEFWLETYLPWFASGFVVVFGYACFRSRRLLIAPMATAVAIVSIAVIAHGTLFRSQSNAQTLQFVDRIIQGGQEQIAILDSVAKTSRYPTTSGVDPYFLAPKPGRVRMMSQVNWTPLSVETGQISHLQLAPVKTESEAQSLWKQNGAEFTHSLTQGLQREKAIRNRLISSKLDAATVGKLALDTSLEALGFLAVIVLLNLLVVGLSAINRKVIAHLWRADRLKVATRG